MESLLGFHPPHFSEEAAWLPGWLQSSAIRDASNQQAFQCSSGQRLEDIGFLQQNINTRENDNLSDNGVCKGFHLFLSGEDTSTMNVPSCSSDHEVRYHLHLSSNEESQNMSNPIPSKSQPEIFEFNQALPDPKDTPEDTRELNHNPSPQKGNLGISSHEPLRLKGQNGKNPKSRKVDIMDAVELAVAASEALIIHEVVKDEPSTQLSTPSSVLEAAIRVKQARLEELNETSGFGESNEYDVDFLSDLDELTMADAYEDVGLTVTGHGVLSGYESISHVKDSYGGLEADFGSISLKQELLLKRGFVLDSIEGGTHKDDIDYAALGTEKANLGCDFDPMFSCSVERPDFCMKEVGMQREGELTSCQTILRTSLGSLASGSDEREDKMTSLVPDKFQSRWFGGWTYKNEVGIPAATENKHKRSIPEPFANETSFLSESVPDMNSGIQKQDNTVSQASVAPKVAQERTTNNGNLLLEDVDISQSSLAPKDSHKKTTINENSPSQHVSITEPSASPMDILCSVVPCSLTSDTLPITHHNVMPLENHFSPTLQANLDNTKTVSPQSDEFLHEKTKFVSEINSESPAVRRQVSSLKTYSMLSYPVYDPYLDKQPTKTPILDFQDDIDGQNPTSKKYTELSEHMEKKTNLPMTISSEENPDLSVVPERNPELLPTKVFRNVKYNIKSCLVPMRKRVHFSEPEISYAPPVKKPRIPKPRVKESYCNPQPKSRVKKHRVTYNKTLFQDLKLLLTGFSIKKHKEIKKLIQKNGGIVLDDIPSPPTPRGKRCAKYHRPLILSPKRLLTTKFLYGCAVNACILDVNWLFDSVAKGSILPPKKYMILKENTNSCSMIIGRPISRTKFVFDDIAIMLHGKHEFCIKMAKVIKHGGGLVFKTIHWLVKSLESKRVSVGAIVVEGEIGISRQLKQCAVEQNIAVLTFDWIVKSLYEGRVVPSPEFKHPSASMPSPVDLELSEEI